MNEQSKQDIFTDLEVVNTDEVKGGPALASVTDLVIDPFDPNRGLVGSRHPGGVNVCLADGSVR